MTTAALHVHTSPTGSRAPGGADGWRWQARRQLADLRDLLVADSSPAYDGWLAARAAGVLRERNALLARIGTMGPRALHDPAIEHISAELARLVVDVDHHLQRRRDLVWDEVELELGGSE